jgi:hypothetical protein
MLAHKKSCGQDHGCWGMHLHPTAAVALSSSLTVTAAVGVLVIAFANLWLPACVSCCPPVGGPGDTDTCAATRSSDFFYVLLSSIVIWTVGGEIGHVWGSCGCGTNILLWICRIRSTFVPVGHTTRQERNLRCSLSAPHHAIRQRRAMGKLFGHLAARGVVWINELMD